MDNQSTQTKSSICIPIPEIPDTVSQSQSSSFKFPLSLAAFVNPTIILKVFQY